MFGKKDSKELDTLKLTHQKIDFSIKIKEEDFVKKIISRKTKRGRNKKDQNNKRPQNCITEKYIQNQRQIQKGIPVVPGNRT